MAGGRGTRLNQLTARRVYEHRVRHGPFRSRQQLKEVSGFGEAAFVQAAGFLKIADGADPLDATWIHPESYDTATAVLESIGATPDDLKTAASPAAAEDSPAGPSLAERLAGVDASQLAARMETGEMLVRDILTQFTRPGRDPREDLPKPMFKSGVLKLEDLSPGMELTGSVLNVVDFGVFVDIGLHDTGLVHVSQLANQFVKDPHEVAAVGDVVTVWVREIDKDRRRVALTMVRPGTQRPPPQRTERKESEQQKDRPPRRTEGRGGRPGGGKPGGGRPGGGKPKFKPPRPKAKPKFVAPITEAMVQGQEPMRTFSDLAQFFNKKSETDGKKDDPA